MGGAEVWMGGVEVWMGGVEVVEMVNGWSGRGGY